MPTMKDLDFDQRAALLNHWHLAKVAASTRHERLLKAVAWFIKDYPQISNNCAYKHLTRVV